jgi:hypothetical protein
MKYEGKPCEHPADEMVVVWESHDHPVRLRCDQCATQWRVTPESMKEWEA